MEKLAYLLSDIIYRKIYVPYSKINDKIDIFFKKNINQNENNLFLLLITIALLIYLFPIMLFFSNYQFGNELLFGGYFISAFCIILLGISVYFKLTHRIKKDYYSEELKADFSSIKFQTIRLNKNIDLINLAVNLKTKKAFKCEKDNLLKVLSNKCPSQKVDIIYIGGNGKLSYHLLFYTFHYILEDGIRNLCKLSKKEFLNYIAGNFTIGEKEIIYKRIRQSYRDWLNETNEAKFIDEFLNIFTSKQPAKV